MKILEPFAGLRLASGHALLHAAFFGATFFVGYKDANQGDNFEIPQGDANNVLDENGDLVDLLPHHEDGNLSEITVTFLVLRYAHLLAFLLHIPSLLKDLGEAKDDDSAFQAAKTAVNHKKVKMTCEQKMQTCEQFTNELSIFVYQGPIFYAQYIIFKFGGMFAEDFSERSDYPDASIHNAIRTVSPLRDWLLIEVFVFYAYLHATVFFIAGYQIRSWCTKKSNTLTDIKKTETDFIMYSRDSLVWFAYNFVNFVMPLVVLSMSYNRSILEVCPSLMQTCGQFNSDAKLFSYILMGLSATQFIQMVFNSKLYGQESLASELDIYNKANEEEHYRSKYYVPM